MAVTGDIDILPAAILARRDARDPLGIWAARGTLVGDATGGTVKATFGLPAASRAAYVFTVGFVSTSSSGVGVTTHTVRLLTNWPSGDRPGVQGASFIRTTEVGSAGSGELQAVGFRPLIDPQMQKILLYDPRSDRSNRIDLLELWLNVNTDGANDFFEAWGWYWDRNLHEVPGGPRYPGSD